MEKYKLILSQVLSQPDVELLTSKYGCDSAGQSLNLYEELAKIEEIIAGIYSKQERKEKKMAY